MLYLSGYCKSVNLFYWQILYTTKLYFYLFWAFKLSKDNLYVFGFHLLYLKKHIENKNITEWHLKIHLTVSGVSQSKPYLLIH